MPRVQVTDENLIQVSENEIHQFIPHGRCSDCSFVASDGCNFFHKVDSPCLCLDCNRTDKKDGSFKLLI